MKSRREFLKAVGLAGAGFVALSAISHRSEGADGKEENKNGPASTESRIDVHHHILPPDYVAAVGEATIGAPAGTKTPQWTVERSLTTMDAQHIATAVVSVSTPSVWLGDIASSRRLARKCNEFAADMVSRHPGRFGFFATLPLPDIKGALDEIRYALDTLRCEGIALATNYEDKYLGDPSFASLFDELNHRKAVVHVHPTTCTYGAPLMIPPAGIEFPHDTTRAIVSLLFSGTLTRCKDVRFIFSHAGGTIPLLAYRIAGLPMLKPELGQQVPEGVLPVLQRQCYDTALSGNPPTLSALLQLVQAKRVLFGTDFPFAPVPMIAAGAAALSKVVQNAEDACSIDRDNAIEMFPGLGKKGVVRT